jgi:DNA-binding transcriptional ArsR family regulator
MGDEVPREIRDRGQLRMLASPVRQELVDLLARTGPASASELSRWIRRPADGLYYHLRALERVGLVRRAGERMRAGRAETLYRSSYAEPKLRHDASPGGNTPAVTAIAASMLRLGIRDFRSAASTRGVRTWGPRRELWALRVVGWLTPDRLAEVNRRMVALQRSVGRPRSKGELYAITVVLTPLHHRARKPQRRPRAAAGRVRRGATFSGR